MSAAARKRLALSAKKGGKKPARLSCPARRTPTEYAQQMNSGPAAADLVRESLNSSIRRLLDRDFFLLQADVNERSITHKLAAYLRAEFPDWDVDCEYNRDRHDPKRLDLPLRDNVSSDDVHAHTVFPDIIVHHRNTGGNLLVIEVKKSSNREDDTWDCRKLLEYQRQLGYTHAAFIRFDVDDQAGRWPSLKWIESEPGVTPSQG